MYLKRFLSVLLSLCLIMTFLSLVVAFSDDLEYTVSEPTEIVSHADCSFTSEGGIVNVDSSSANSLKDYGIKYTVTDTIPSGHVVLLHFGAVSIDRAADVLAEVRTSSGTLLCAYTYPLVTQWNDVYMPVDIGSSNASNVVINLYTGGADVKFDTVTMTDYGATTVKALVGINDGTLAIRSGMWMRGQNEDWQYEAIPNTDRFASELTDCYDVISDENYIYALDNSGKKLQIVDIKTGNVVGMSERLAAVRQIAWVDANTVFVTSREAAAWIIDVTDRTNPTVLCHYDSIEMATGIDVSGNIAAVTNRTFGVEIVDISDRTNPLQLSIIKCGEAQSCRISGKYMFAGIWAEGKIKIYDIEDPSNPKAVSQFELLGQGDGLEVHGNYVYCATGQNARKYGATGMESSDYGKPGYAFGNGMEIWDISDINNPVRCAVTRTDGKLYINNHDTWDVTLGTSNGHLYAYLNDAYQGVYVYNVDNPYAPERVAHITVRKPSSPLTSSSRVYVFPYDQTQYSQCAVDGTTIQNGSLYLASSGGGINKFTADFVGSQVTTAHTCEFNATENSAYAADLTTLKRLFDTNTRNVLSYHSGHQIYAALEENGYVYVAEGLGGLKVLNKADFSTVQEIPTGDITYDIKIYNHVLYSANGTDGLISYNINPSNGKLTATGNVYKSFSGSRALTMKHMLLSPKANYAILHVDDADIDIVDLRTYTRVKGVMPNDKPMATSGLMYYRQITPQLINNRYAAAWGQASNIFVIDFGENDDGPVITRDLNNNTINFNRGMTQNIFPVPDGRVATVYSGSGYILYDINDLTKNKVYDSATDTIYPVSGLIGKGIYLDGLGVVTDRVGGSCHIVDMTKLEEPDLLFSFTLASNPDIASASEDTLYIPAGYEGLYSIPLDNIKGRMLGKEVIPQGATVLMNEDFSEALDTNVWTHASSDTELTIQPSEVITSGKLQMKSGDGNVRQTGQYGLFNKKVPLKSSVDTSDGTYITDIRANATLTVMYSMDVSAYEELTKNRVVYSGLHNSSTITPSTKSGGANNLIAGSIYYNSYSIENTTAYTDMAHFEYGDYTQWNSKTNSPDVVDDSYFDAASSRIKIVMKITDKYGNYYDSPKVSMYYQSSNNFNWVGKEVEDLPALSSSDYVDCLYFMSDTNNTKILVDDVVAYYTDTEIGEEPVYPDIEPVLSNDLLDEHFDSALDTSVWGYSYTNIKADPRVNYTGSTAKLDNGALYMKTYKAESTSSYVGGFYGKFNKKVPIKSSYTDDGTYMTDFGKNTKLVATFKLDTTGLNTASSVREVYFGLHNSSKVNDASAENLASSPYGRKGAVGARLNYKDASSSNYLKLLYNAANKDFLTAESLSKIAYYKMEMAITDENGAFLNDPKYTLSYRTSESDPWTVSNTYAIGSDYASKLGYIDCLYFTMTGSSSYIHLDDVNVYLTHDYSTAYQNGIASFFTPEDSDCLAVVAAYGSNNTLKSVIINDKPLIRGVNKVSLKDLDTDEAEYIRVMLWKGKNNIEPLCTPTLSYLE